MLGDKIRRLRVREEKKQEDIAKKIGISRSTLGMYEQNRRMPDIETVKRLADVFNVSIDWLLDHKLDDDELKGMEEFRKLLVNKHIMSDGQDLTPEQFNSLIDAFKVFKEVNEKK
jgi:transcriptional regulator with XRE-family HTH domain